MKLLLALLIVPLVLALDCVEPFDGMNINQSAVFCSDTFDVSNGISISESDVVVDCQTAILRGTKGQSDVGIKIVNANNVTLRNCQVLTFDQGLLMKNVTHSFIEKNNFA